MRLWTVPGDYGQYSMTIHVVMAKTKAKAVKLVREATSGSMTKWKQVGAIESYRLHKLYDKEEEHIVYRDTYIE